MLVALNLLYLRPGLVGGTETYAAGLLYGLEQTTGDERFLVLLNKQSADWPTPPSSRFTRYVCDVDGGNQVARYFFEQSRLPSVLRHHGADLVHSLGYVSPLVTGCPRVVTIPDLNYVAFGNQMRKGRKLALQTFVPLSARRAQRVLTLSTFSRNQILQHVNVPDDRVTVTLLGVTPPADPDGRAWAWRPTEERYFIAFGSTTPNKNLGRLIEAMPREPSAPRLVIVGHVPDDVKAKGFESGVIFTGFLDANRLHDALVGSEALVFPSLYEGFGLPVLEAMALGVPVLCSTAASLPEVAGDAARYFDPLDVQQMRARITEVASSPALRREMRSQGISRAASFTWRSTAEQTLNVYRDVLAVARRRSA